jgi:hypothetical protein
MVVTAGHKCFTGMDIIFFQVCGPIFLTAGRQDLLVLGANVVDGWAHF